MKIYQISKLLLICMLVGLFSLPAIAQETTEGEDDPFGQIEMTFTGYISFDEDGNILIDDFFLAPAGAISPSLLSDGQYVEVTGFFLNDNTFQLANIDLTVVDPDACDDDQTTPEVDDDCIEEPTDDDVVDCDAEGLTETTDDDCDDVVDCDAEGLTETTDDDCDDVVDCDAGGLTETTDDDCVVDDETGNDCTHPVANRIANAFDVDPCDVEAMHAAGNGYGNIARAFLLADAANQALEDGLAEGEELDPMALTDAQAFLDLHQSGTGWGQIVKASGVSPSSLAPGQLKKLNNAADETDDADTDETDDADEESTSANSVNGNSNANNGNGNGNNGNGNGNNGNGNGNNGNGNGNNGNGNGNNGNGNGNNGNGNNGNGNGNGNGNNDNGNGNNGNGNGGGKGKGKGK